MITLEIDNLKARIVGQMSPDNFARDTYNKALRIALAYRVPAADFSPAYKAGAWDGLISLYNPWKQEFPAGLVAKGVELFHKLQVPFRFVDKRVRPESNITIETAFTEYGRELRFYQSATCDKAIEKTRGIVEIGTGGGKTLIACELLSRLGVAPVVFVVPRRTLLRQTHDEFEKYLRVNGAPAEVGMIGDSVCDINLNGINVCTYQTLLAAFNETYAEHAGKDPKTGKKLQPNRIDKNDLAGEAVKKTTAELEADFARLEAALTQAEQLVGNKLSALRTEIAIAEQRWLAAGGPSKLKREQTAFQKEQSRREREIEKIIKKGTEKERKSFDQAKTALEGRRASIRRKAAIRDLVEKSLAFIVDEIHIAAVIIETLGGHAANAYFRFGFSATPYREDNQEIRIEGTMGRKLISIGVSDLTDLGYLCPGFFVQVPVQYIAYDKEDTYRETYGKHIVHCWERNYYIKHFAEELKTAGIPTLIVVDYIEHGRRLEEMIQDSVFVEGSDDGSDDEEITDEEQDYRRRMLNRCERNEIILIATSWVNTGIDAPRLQALIMGGSITSANTLYQTVGRVTRCVGKDIEESTANGKSFFMVVDFNMNEPTLHKQSVQRIKVFKLERAWEVKRLRA